MHRHLCQLFPHYSDLRFPGKKYIGYMSPEFIDERQRQLQAYMRELIVQPEAWHCETLISFLDHPDNVLGVQFNLVVRVCVGCRLWRCTWWGKSGLPDTLL